MHVRILGWSQDDDDDDDGGGGDEDDDGDGDGDDDDDDNEIISMFICSNFNYKIIKDYKSIWK